MSTEQKIISTLHSLMNGRSFLQGRGLISRIAERASIDPVDVRLALGRLARQGILEGVSDKGEIFGRVSLTIAPPETKEPRSLTRWRAAMQAIGLANEDLEALCPCHDRLDDFPEKALRDVAKGLLSLRAEQSENTGTPRFVLSAKYLLGSSKLLGNLPPSSLRAFGLSIDAYPDAIPHLITAGPEDPEAVLLVENPHSFEEAIAAGCAKSIGLIVAYGYGLSRSGEAYGNRLVESVDTLDILIPLVRAGNPPTPRLLLSHPKLLFWGDLDREGLRIYASLKKRLPALQASALYRPMARALEAGIGHPYVKATAKNNQNFPDSVPNDVGHLINLCANNGIDQEIVSREDIALLAKHAMGEIG